MASSSRIRDLLGGSDPARPPMEQSILSRCVASLQLCHHWLRSRTQHHVAMGAPGPLLLLTHGDLPVLQTESERLCCSVTESPDFLARNQQLCLQIQTAADTIRDLAVTLPHTLSAACRQVAQGVFRQQMPAGRHWRGKFPAGPGVAPSDYAVCAARAVLVPVLDGIRVLPLDCRMPALSAVISAFMEAWMGHILHEGLRFR
ncbi:coiled-coil domain-containing protein 142-like [Ascaphus truei]|uniref:coiled-coil domain-containing protein 142-like n=1 Tax=Ascaphus truei TaxID=8439 RepID=UPI003F598824